MPRPPRIIADGHVYHVHNRAIAGELLFEESGCYRDFLHVLRETVAAISMPLLAYALMPNHWHLLVRPVRAADLPRFVHQLSRRHARRHHMRKGMLGRGAVYQGRYRSHLVQDDDHLATVCRYIERNALRANLVRSAPEWPWSSVPQRATMLGLDIAYDARGIPLGGRPPLAPFPAALPKDWLRWLDEPQTEAELDSLRKHLQAGSPYGTRAWREAFGQFRRPGRPRK